MKRVIEGAESVDAGKDFHLSCIHSFEQNPSHSLGDQIECLECEALSFPEGLRPYKRTPIFTEHTRQRAEFGLLFMS